MTKVSSRFLAVLMLAVLAVADVTTTSAFAQRGGFRFRATPHVHDVLKPNNFDALHPNRVENPGAIIREYLREDLEAPPSETDSQSGAGLRPYPLPDRVW